MTTCAVVRPQRAAGTRARNLYNLLILGIFSYRPPPESGCGLAGGLWPGERPLTRARRLRPTGFTGSRQLAPVEARSRHLDVRAFNPVSKGLPSLFKALDPAGPPYRVSLAMARPTAPVRRISRLPADRLPRDRIRCDNPVDAASHRTDKETKECQCNTSVSGPTAPW